MIISASRRTDIPAFFSEWLMERIRLGYFIRINPFRPQQQQAISLIPEAVEAIVFWSKNPEPLLPRLKLLDEQGYRYYFQFTLNNYPGFVEPGIPALAARIDIFKRLSDRIGPAKVIWRYDPIIISNITGVDYHTRQFETMAGILNGYTHRVVISFLDIYSKLKSRLAKLSKEYGMEIANTTGGGNTAEGDGHELVQLASALSSIAMDNSLEIFTCAEKVDPAGLDSFVNQASDQRQFGIQHGSCIDVHLINRLFGLNLQYRKDRSQRRECLCAVAVDLGVYNTCKFNCTYCYANSGNPKP